MQYQSFYMTLNGEQRNSNLSLRKNNVLYESSCALGECVFNINDNKKALNTYIRHTCITLSCTLTCHLELMQMSTRALGTTKIHLSTCLILVHNIKILYNSRKDSNSYKLLSYKINSLH